MEFVKELVTKILRGLTEAVLRGKSDEMFGGIPAETPRESLGGTSERKT